MTQVEMEQIGPETYRTHHDIDDHGLSITIFEAVAEIEDDDVSEWTAEFTDRIDPVALDRLFRDGVSHERNGMGSLHLTVQDIDVTVHSDGEIHIGA